MTISTSRPRARHARTRAALMTGLLLCLTGPCAARAAMTVYYLRHAEGGHNVKGEYIAKKIPTNEWPAWVGNENVFTPLGLAQVQACVTNLQTLTFDLIAVSPVWRARNTVLPYLRATAGRAELWPELTETHPVAAGAMPAPGTTGVRQLDTLAIPANEARYFTMRIDAAGRRAVCATNAAGAVLLAQHVERLLRARTNQQDMTVLLVGHGNAGMTLLRQLTRNRHAKLSWLRNATLWMAREQPDGSFTLCVLNGATFQATPAITR